jgi:threonine synthase
MKLRDADVIKQSETVVVILTAHGSKFSNTAVEYHQDSSNKFANQTKTVKPELIEIERILDL